MVCLAQRCAGHCYFKPGLDAGTVSIFLFIHSPICSHSTPITPCDQCNLAATPSHVAILFTFLIFDKITLSCRSAGWTAFFVSVPCKCLCAMTTSIAITYHLHEVSFLPYPGFIFRLEVVWFKFHDELRVCLPLLLFQDLLLLFLFLTNQGQITHNLRLNTHIYTCSSNVYGLLAWLCGSRAPRPLKCVGR